jgi:hypothetical protein
METPSIDLHDGRSVATAVPPPNEFASPCPGAEQLGAYLDNRLPFLERADVEAHLAECDRCRVVLADTVRALERRRPSETPTLPDV